MAMLDRLTRRGSHKARYEANPGREFLGADFALSCEINEFSGRPEEEPDGSIPFVPLDAFRNGGRNYGRVAEATITILRRCTTGQVSAAFGEITRRRIEPCQFFAS